VSREETPALEGDFPRSQNDKKMTPTHIITSNNNQKKKNFTSRTERSGRVSIMLRRQVFSPRLC
jgi:hypothetical protein